MSLNKVNYVNGTTVIMAENLNAIQDEIIANASAIGTQATAIQNLGTNKANVTALNAEASARAEADTAIGGELDDLKSAFSHRTAGVLDVVDGVGDLDVADPSGNVLVRLAGGEIQTKKFDSSILKMLNEDGGNADLDISDIYGNVLARFDSGNFETRNFKGFQYITFFTETANYTGQSLTLTIDKTFRRGDRIVIHMERGAKPWNYGAVVSYFEGNTPIRTDWRGDCTWLEHTVMQDGVTISAEYAASATGMTNGPVRLEVSLLGDVPISPNVVTVKQDGSGDYTTLRGALDSIGTSANDVLNPYRIEIYPGSYNVMEDYTDEEIADAAYDNTHFVGPRLLNGMYLAGMGNTPDEVVLNGDLDPDTWAGSVRDVVSTLNCQGTCGFENLTVIAKNLRYCVHDDYTLPVGQRAKRVVKKCVFRGYNLSYNPGTTYGGGTRYSTGEFVFEDCDFGENGGLHTSTNLQEPAFVHLINCKGHGFRIGDNETASPVTGYSIYQFDNCDFLWILCRTDGEEPHVIVRGSGNNTPLYQADPQTLYDTGDVVVVPNSGKESQYSGVGTVVEMYVHSGHGPRFRAATSYDTAYGIIVWEDSDNTYIQTRGYVRTDRTGIIAPVLGDYVGVVNGAVSVVQDASTAIGRVAYIDNDNMGYIKLNWRF